MKRPEASSASRASPLTPRPWSSDSSASDRVSTQATGRPSRRAAQATRASSRERPPFIPNEPPTSGAITRSASSSQPKSAASPLRMANGLWVLVVSSSRPSGATRPQAARGSMVQAATRVMSTANSVTCAASAKARPAAS